MAFKSSNITSTPDQKSLFNDEYYEKVFSNEIVQQITKMVFDSIVRITKSRSYFKEDDIVLNVKNQAARELNDDIVEKIEFEMFIRHAIEKSDLVKIGSTIFFTTKEIASREKDIILLAGATGSNFVLTDFVVKKAVDEKEKTSNEKLSKEQFLAVESACKSKNRVTVIEGSAGAGKSFTMEAVKDAYSSSGFRVIGTAVAWAAAKVLEKEAKLDGCVPVWQIVNSMLESREAGTEYFRVPTLLIVDEAGMVGTNDMYHILNESAKSKVPVKVILTGDSLQLQPVDAGNALETIVEFHGSTRINEIKRQNQISHRVAVTCFSQRRTGEGLYILEQQEAINWCKNRDELIDLVVRDYISYRKHYPENTALILALSNKEVSLINERIRCCYKKLGLIDDFEINIKVTDGREIWESFFSVGDQIVLRANDRNALVYKIDKSKKIDKPETWDALRVGVFNKGNGIIAGIIKSKNPNGSFDVVIDLEGSHPGRIIVNTHKFRHKQKYAFPVVHNFASTMYSSQGQTVDKVFFIDSPYMNFRYAYVGMSRHRKFVDVYLNETDLHVRMNKMTDEKNNITQALNKTDSEVKIELGLYKRSEMLQTVARTWALKTVNLTSLMFEREKRLKINRKENLELFAKLQKPKELLSDVIDFIPSNNQPIPLVDIEKILNLQSKVSASKTIKPSSVDQKNLKLKMSSLNDLDDNNSYNNNNNNNNNNPHEETNSHNEVSASSLFNPKKLKDINIFLSKTYNWFKREFLVDNDNSSDGNSAYNGTSKNSKSVNSNEIIDFENISSDDDVFVNPFKYEQISKDNTKPFQLSFNFTKQQDLFPMIQNIKPIGLIKDEIIDFVNVPQTETNKQNSLIVSENLLKETKGELWDIGRFNEPRILAKDANGEIRARYRLDGKCVVGECFPPILYNPYSKQSTQVIIVPGPKEWFLTFELLSQKYKNNKQKIPHIIWHAKDMDWGFLKQALAGKSVVIVRSKTDSSQIAWALNVQETLKNLLLIEPTIKPRIPNSTSIIPNPSP